MGEKASGWDLYPYEGSRRRRKTPQAHFCPGEWAADWAPLSWVLCRGDKPPCLLGKMLGKIEDMEKPRLHLWGVHRCLFASRQGRESSTLAAVSLPHSPIQAGQTQQPHSLHAMAQGLGQPGPRKGSDLVIHRWPRDLGSDPWEAAATTVGTYTGSTTDTAQTSGNSAAAQALATNTL